jgi:ATP-dependent DNA helicase RecG
VRALRSALAAGGIQIALGTHALIQEGVVFHSLGLVIVDEQHRFGVLQRAHLLGKGRTPHALVMSATPIPRTLALTLFGDLDLTVIDEKPPGRVAPKTHLLPEGRYAAMLDYIAGELDRGAQAYFVCPLVEASEELDLKAATELHERLQHEERLAGHRGGLLHGRMKSEEKDRVMRAFAAGEFRYLVSTTVIEVGVDVPNASLMVIEHPERFGLSQLHQLRGRVGRGRQPAHVFLVRRKGIGPDAARRLAVMVGESDGFKIAEEDLRQRGPGDFFGVRQSGLPPLKVADPIGDPGLLESARRDAFDLVAAEGLAALAAGPLWRRLEMRFGDRMKLYAVG